MAAVKEKTKRQLRDPVATKARILESAVSEFSKKGYDGARVEGIAQKAKSNINLVYHYFGSKENLFIAVMEQSYGLIRSHHNDIDLRTLPAEEAMRKLVSSTFRMFINYPELIGLIATTNLNEARHIQHSRIIAELYKPFIDFIKEILRRGESEGVFRAAVDPVELFISINAEGYFYLSNRYTLGFILQQNLVLEERLHQREKFIVDIIMSFLRP